MQFWRHLLLAVALATLTLPANAVYVTVNEHELYHTLENTSSIKAGEYYSNAQTINTILSISDLGLNDLAVNWELTARITNDGGTKMRFAIKRMGDGNCDAPCDNTISDESNNIYLNSSNTPISWGKGLGNRTNIPFTITIDNFDVTDGYGEKNIHIEYQVTTQEITTTP